jgi:1-acyl-sn-glycerol-3-phosphate acyltransferase
VGAEPRHLPRRGNRLTRWLGRALLRALGWRIQGSLPDLPKQVVIAAPHSSNWDWVYGMGAMFALGVRVSWMGKQELFGPFLGAIMRWFGGIPVDRAATGGMVGQMVAAFESRERLLLGITPEGTRQRVERWKTGFHRIAQGAGVPITLTYLDYAKREIGVGPTYVAAEDRELDIAHIRAFYRDIQGRYYKGA